MSTWQKILSFEHDYQMICEYKFKFYVQSEDYQLFWNSVKNGEFYIANEVATIITVKPFVEEYAKGFEEGFNNFDSIVSSDTIFKGDDGLAESLWSRTNRYPYPYIINVWETYFGSDKKYLALDLMYDHGKEGGVYYRTIQTIIKHKNRFKKYMEEEDTKSNEHVKFLIENGADCFVNSDYSEEEKNAIIKGNELDIANYLASQNIHFQPITKKQEKDFSTYLHHDNKDALIDKLHELIDGKRGKLVVTIIIALEKLNFIGGYETRAALYNAMRDEFGDIGANAGLNDFMANDYKISEIDLNRYIEILGNIK